MSKIDPRLIEGAASSVEGLLRLLTQGLEWPIPQDADLLEDPDLLLEWDPAELQLDPSELGTLTAIRQIAPLTTNQPFGVFVLTFEGGRLPIGALRRVVRQLVRRRRKKHVENPTWELGDLLFFCHSDDGRGYLHIVALSDEGDGPDLRTISWSSNPTPTRRALLSEHTLPDLAWPEENVPVDQWRHRWRSAFTGGYRQGVKTAEQLSQRMAEVASDVRTEISDLLAVETPDGPLHALLDDMRVRLDAGLDEDSFGDVFAQTLVYGLLSARISHPEQFAAAEGNALLDFENPFLDAIYGAFRSRAEDSLDLDHLGLTDLAHTLTQTDIDALLADFGTNDRRDDPVIYLYEEFLDKYDRAQRKELGAYYTPIPVVNAIVHLVDEVLRDQLGFADGIADQETWAQWAERTGLPHPPPGVAPDSPVISMIDPATGTGTFLLSWLREAKLKAPSTSTGDLLNQMSALELSMASYSVAHLKVSLELPPAQRAVQRLPIYLCDTLAGRRHGHFAELADPVAQESLAAEALRLDTPRTVVIGNPPYLRTSAAADDDHVGGMVRRDEHGGPGLIRDFTEPLSALGAGVHAKNLYNLYVYFWRWAMWKVSQHAPGPGVIGMITASSFLGGPGFAGMRQAMRQEFDDIWIIDLGGEGRGARRDENVFDGVMTPVCITIAVRAGKAATRTPAKVHYQRLEGTRAEKFSQLAQVSVNSGSWLSSLNTWHEPLFPAAGGDYQDYPLLTDVFPWQHSGVQFKRTWPIATSQSTLESRWTALATAPTRERASLLKESPDRKVDRSYPAALSASEQLPPLAKISRESAPEAIMRYAYRSFDSQWCIADNRLAARLRPPLWASLSEEQIFMTSLLTGKIGSGPAATATPYVPDLDCFRGSYGAKHVVPLYRDAAGTPNMDPAVLDSLRGVTGSEDLSTGDLFAYCYGILAGTDYSSRFSSELEVPGPRVPITTDPELFSQVVLHGRALLYLHTWRTRLASDAVEAAVPDCPAPSWDPEPISIPDSVRDCVYDPESESLSIGGGRLKGVSAAAWEFEVSGMKVMRKWIGYRTLGGSGRAASSTSPLDRIRPTAWQSEWSEDLANLAHTLHLTGILMDSGRDLLSKVLAGTTVRASQLPPPSPSLREAPDPGERAGGQGSLL